MADKSLAEILNEKTEAPKAALAPAPSDLARILNPETQPPGAATPEAPEPPTGFAPGRSGMPESGKTVVLPGATTTIPSFLTEKESENAIPLADVPGHMLHNFLPSMGKIIDAIKSGDESGGKAMAKTIHDPVGAFNDVKDAIKKVLPDLPGHMINLGASIMQNMYNRYGIGTDLTGKEEDHVSPWEKIKKTASEDPAGFAADALSFLPPGALEGVTAKSLGIPLGKAAANTADVISQTAHGAGPGAIRELFNAGKDVTPGVWSTLTKGLDREKVYNQLSSITDDLLKQRHDNYDAVMSQVEGSKQPLSFDKIDKAVGEAGKITTYSPPGSNKTFMIEQDPAVKDFRGKALALVENYRALGPEFHTAFGLDKLKQSLYSLAKTAGLDNKGMPTAANAFVGKIANAVKDTIIKETPVYGKAMQNYSNDTNFIENFNKEFKSGDPAKQMQSVRSLQQVWRNTAGTAHEMKNQLMREAVEKTGDKTLMPQLAAEQYHNILRGGLGRYLPTLAIPEIGSALMRGRLGEAAAAAGTAVATGLATSPRLAGTAAYGAGRLSQAPGVRSIPSIVRKAEAFTPDMLRINRAQQANEEYPGRKRGGYFASRKKR